MPKQRNIFIPSNLLGVFSSPSGLTDLRTGLPYQAGGLMVGEAVELTEAEAQAASGNTLHRGTYRFVQVDTGATAADILAGCVGGMLPGKFVQSVVIKTAGSGQTAGTYTATASSGSATIQYVINASGALASVIVTGQGSAYTSTPTFTIAAGGTPGIVSAQMGVGADIVTSINSALFAGLRTVVFLAPLTSAQVTAGAYVFVQELGVALLLGKSSLTNGSPAVGDTIIIPASSNGTVDDPTQSGDVTYALWPTVLGTAIDIPVAGQLFKVLLDLPYIPG
jgi:hypothetical protein